MSAAEKAEVEVYLSLGSNIAPERNLPLAVEKLGEFGEVLAVSEAWESPPVGTSGANFLNAAVLLRTSQTLKMLKLEMLRPIEEAMGRVRGEDKNAPRPIDLDILIYNGRLLDEELWKHAHLAVPLAALHPSYTHPVSGETLASATRKLQDSQRIQRREGVLAAFDRR